MLREAAFDAFESYMVEIINKSSGRVSTKTACDISAQLVIGLFQPICQQIDPHKLSEVNRMMKIAKDYGERLGTPNLKALPGFKWAKEPDRVSHSGSRWR